MLRRTLLLFLSAMLCAGCIVTIPQTPCPTCPPCPPEPPTVASPPSETPQPISTATLTPLSSHPGQYLIEYIGCIQHGSSVGVVKGVIYDRDGNVIPDAEVHITLDGWPYDRPARSNGAGWYEFYLNNDLDVRIVRLVIRGEEVPLAGHEDLVLHTRPGCFEQANIRQQSSLEPSPAPPATLTPGPTKAPLGTFVGSVVEQTAIDPGKMFIRGHVLDKGDRGVQGTRVQIQAWDWKTMAVTDGNGQFAFDGLGNPVTYTLTLLDLLSLPFDVAGEWGKIKWVQFIESH